MEVSVLQSEEQDIKERGRFLSEREDEILDAFDNAESRGGGEVLVDEGLLATIPAAELIADEWLQFSFDPSEIPLAPFDSS